MTALLILLTLSVVCYTAFRELKRKRANSVTVIPPKQKLSRINTLLQNVEVYDGTPKGQTRIGGDRL